MDIIGGENELTPELRTALKDMSNVRALTSVDKQDGGMRKKQIIGGMIILLLLFGYALATSFMDWINIGEVGPFLLFLIFYLGCNLGLFILVFFDRNSLKRYKRAFMAKGYVNNIIPIRGMTFSIIYFDFENNEFRTGVCRGEAFEKQKYSVQNKTLADIYVVEKRSGIRFEVENGINENGENLKGQKY